MAGKAEVKVVISGDAKGATQAASQAEKSLGKLGTAAGQLGKAIDDKLGSTALGSKLGKSFGSFEQAGQKAFTNLGTGASGLGSLMGPAIAGGAVAAGAAIGKFALDGVNKFEDLALEVGKFSDATGLSTQEASKFIEVAKDLKIDPNTFESAFVKMEKGISTNRKAFGDLVVTAKNGSVDLTATFLNVVQHLQGIKDPLDRANESAKLFGKGFTGISEILGTSADDLSKRLAAVGDQAGKIITPEELAQAKNYRDAMDNFHDAIENVQIELGQYLIPTLTNAAQSAADLVTALGKLPSVKIPDLPGSKTQGTTLGTYAKAVVALVPPLRALFGAGKDFKPIEVVTPDQIAATAGMTTKAQLYEAALTKAGGAMTATEIAASSLSETVGSGAGSFRQADEAATAYAASSAASAAASAKLQQANDHDISSTLALAAQHRAAADAINAQTDAILGLNDATSAADHAELTFLQAQKSANQAILDAAKAKKGDRIAQLGATTATEDAVTAGRAYAQQIADQTTKTKGAAAGHAALIGALQRLANESNGPVKDALNGDIFRLQAVGKLHPNPTVSVNDQASAKAARIRDNINGIRFLSVAATINATGNAIQKIQEAIRLGQQFAGSTYTADVNAKLGAHAAGGPMRKGEVSLVGERGPELFVARTAGTIIPNSALMSGRSGGWTGGGNGGGNTYITVQGAVDPVATAKQIKAILAKGERAGVR